MKLDIMRHQKPQTLILYLLISMVMSYFIFAATSTIPFYHHDFYKYSRNIACVADGSFHFLLNIGRPGSAALDCLNSKVAYTLAGASYLRIACSLGIGLMMGLFAYWLCLNFFSFWTALFLSAAIFFLPALQTVMIMTADYLLVSIIFAFIANLIIAHGLQIISARETKSLLKPLFIIAIGSGCMLISLFTYPSLSAFYLIPTLALLLFSPLTVWSKTRTRIICDCISFIGFSIIFYLIAKYIQVHRSDASLPTAYQYKMNFDFIPRIITLIKIFPMLWNVYFGTLQSIIVYLIVTAGTLAALIRYHWMARKQKYHVLGQALLGALVITALISAFFIVQPLLVAFSRIIFGFQALAVLVVAWSLWQISLLSTRPQQIYLVLVALMFLAAGVSASYITTRSALNDNMEINFITSSIAAHTYYHKPLTHIHLIAPSNSAEKSFEGLPQREDIFNLNSSVQSDNPVNMVNTATIRLTGHIGSFKNCISEESDPIKFLAQQKDCIESTEAKTIAVSFSREGKDYYKTPGMLVIDMNILTHVNKSQTTLVPIRMFE